MFQKKKKEKEKKKGKRVQDLARGAARGTLHAVTAPATPAGWWGWGWGWVGAAMSSTADMLVAEAESAAMASTTYVIHVK